MADTPDTTPPNAAAPAPAGMKRRLPLLAALAGGLAVGAGTGAVVVGPVAAKALGFSTTADAASPAGDAGGHDAPAEDDGHGGPAADSGAGSDSPLVSTLDNLVLNPAGSGGTRFLLLTVSMECASNAGLATLAARDAELRDVVLSTLSRKTVDELADVASRDSIKTELITALNGRFGKGTVLRVYFPQYVVQ